MRYDKTARGIEVPQQAAFDLEQTLSCGQCFRWEKQGDRRFFLFFGGKSLTVWEDLQTQTVVFEGVSEEEFLSVWADYFDLRTDYDAIRQTLSGCGPVLEEAAAFAPGIRILRQDPWEALCTFIISQNNNIPRIKGIVARLCENFGAPVSGGFAFPAPTALAGLSPEDLAPLRCGFRAAYLCSAARLVADGTVDLEQLRTLPLPAAREMLQQIHGVGPKVAECVLLYGLHRLECFPMDVWMKRVMARLFPGKDETFFGPYAGVAQQYLFHYSRLHPHLFD